MFTQISRMFKGNAVLDKNSSKTPSKYLKSLTLINVVDTALLLFVMLQKAAQISAPCALNLLSDIPGCCVSNTVLTPAPKP